MEDMLCCAKMGHFPDNGLDVEPPSSGLVSWEYLNYLSPETSSAPAPVTDDLQFGDKLGDTKTSASASPPASPAQQPPHPQPVFQVYSVPPPAAGVTLVADTDDTEDEEADVRHEIVPVLNNRQFSGDSYNWATFHGSNWIRS